MRNLIFISFLFLSTICIAQENNSISESEKEYIELLNHTPNNFKIDLDSKPSSSILKGDLNSIWKLKMAYRLEDKLNSYEIGWLEEQISQLAVAFYLEKMPLLIESVGGFYGCPELLLRNELRNERNITILSICSGGCVTNNNLENFIKIFNNRTERLLVNSSKSISN